MQNELTLPIWSVITSASVVASHMTYDDAKQVCDAHARETKDGGTCVVTDKAAGAQKGKAPDGQQA